MIPYGRRKVKSYDLLSRDCHMTMSYAVAGKQVERERITRCIRRCFVSCSPPVCCPLSTRTHRQTVRTKTLEAPGSSVLDR